MGFVCLYAVEWSRSFGVWANHDDVIKWKHFPRYWPFVRGIHRSPVNSPHKGQWRGASMFTLICARINGWVNNVEAGDLRRNSAHYDVMNVRNFRLLCAWFFFGALLMGLLAVYTTKEVGENGTLMTKDVWRYQVDAVATISLVLWL